MNATYTIRANRGTNWDHTPVIRYELFKRTPRSRKPDGMFCTTLSVARSEPMSAHKRAIRYLLGLTTTGTAKLIME